MDKLKISLVVVLFSFSIIPSIAQSDAIATDTEWLEKQLNTLVKGKKSTAAEKFEFDHCQCKYTSKTDNGGFSLSKSNDFDLKEINNVSYSKNEDGTYELRLKMKTDDDAPAPFDLSSVNAILYTSNEAQVKEIVKKFKSSIKTCNAGNK